VATPIGNRDDISLRAIETLRGVDRIVAEDTRHSRPLLEHLGVQRPMLALHEYNEDGAARRVIGHLRDGESLAVISDAGTPLISDPGFPLVHACREQGIRVVPVPGPSALIAALSVSGLPTDRFRFEGFLPRRSSARLAHLETLRREASTLVFYESSHRILDCLNDLVAVFGEVRPAALARELTKVHETVLADPLAVLRDHVATDDNQRRGEIVLLVGGARGHGGQHVIETDALLGVLLEELPLKQAAALAARITGDKKNRLYQRALELARD
jgi:16S rRNA (cytidine1402-2'-O)-methyltransferase